MVVVPHLQQVLALAEFGTTLSPTPFARTCLSCLNDLTPVTERGKQISRIRQDVVQISHAFVYIDRLVARRTIRLGSRLSRLPL